MSWPVEAITEGELGRFPFNDLKLNTYRPEKQTHQSLKGRPTLAPICQGYMHAYARLNPDEGGEGAIFFFPSFLRQRVKIKKYS